MDGIKMINRAKPLLKSSPESLNRGFALGYDELSYRYLKDKSTLPH